MINKFINLHIFVIRNLAQGPVLKASYFGTYSDYTLVHKTPEWFPKSKRTVSTIDVLSAQW